MRATLITVVTILLLSGRAAGDTKVPDVNSIMRAYAGRVPGSVS